MDNNVKLLSGHRDLTQEEHDLIDEIKQLEAQCLKAVDKVSKQRSMQLRRAHDNPDEVFRHSLSESARWIATAQQDIQTGFMALVRAVAKPQPIQLEDSDG